MKKLFLFLIVSIILVSLIIFSLYIYNPNFFLKVELTFSPKFSPILISEESSIHFYKDGIIVIDENLRYYDWNGNETDPNLLYESPDEAAKKILLEAGNYIVTDKGVVYNTSTVPFNRVYENGDMNILDMKDFRDFLLILTKDNKGKGTGKPYLLINGNDFLISLDGLGSTHYLTSDCHIDTEGLSVLTLDVDSPVPVTRVFHYSYKNQPYGVLTLDDSFYYDIYRLKKHIIIIGSNHISCYNIDNGAKPIWTIDKSGLDFETVKTGDSLLIYLKGSLTYNKKEVNTVFVDKEGNYNVKMLPKFLSDLKPFGKGFISLQYDNTVIVLDKQGKVISKSRLNKTLKNIFTTEYMDDTVFLTTKDNELISLTTSRGKE